MHRSAYGGPATHDYLPTHEHEHATPHTFAADSSYVDTAQIRALREHASALQRHLAATAERVAHEDAAMRGRGMSGGADAGARLGFDAEAVGESWAALYALGNDEHERDRTHVPPVSPGLTMAHEPAGADTMGWRNYYV